MKLKKPIYMLSLGLFAAHLSQCASQTAQEKPAQPAPAQPVVTPKPPAPAAVTVVKPLPEVSAEPPKINQLPPEVIAPPPPRIIKIEEPPVQPEEKTLPQLQSYFPALLNGAGRASFKHYAGADLVNAFINPQDLKTYRECGVKGAALGKYVVAGQSVQLSVYDMATPFGAFCIYAQEKSLDGNPVADFDSPQGQAHRRPGAMFVRQGRFYIKMKAGHSNILGGGKAAQGFTQSFVAQFPKPSVPDAVIQRISRLPMIGRIPGSDKYLPSRIFNFESLSKGFSAEYGCGSSPLTVVRFAASEKTSVDMMIKQFEDEIKQKGYELKKTDYSDSSWVFKTANGMSIYLVRVSDQLAAFETEGSASECDHIPAELIRAMRE